MSEQPAQHGYAAPMEDDLDIGFRVYNTVPKYNAQSIADTLAAPIFRETTPEELIAMAVREASLQLTDLHDVRKQRLGN